MTTHQDQPPLSRRALRQERSRAEEIDDSAEADRAPSGRRARAAAPEGLVEVSNTAPAPAEAADDAEAPATQQFSTDSSGTDSSTADVEATPVLTDSAIPKAFPFADQVEATSDDAGHPGFRLRDFSPELSTARADSQSAHDWTPSNSDESVPLEYQTQGAPAFGYVSPYAEPVAPAEAEPSFDSLFSDLLAPEAVADGETAAEAADDDSTEPESAASEPAAEAPVEPVVPVGAPVVVDEPVALVAPLEVAPEERTLSRREWRAMRAAEAAAAEAAAGSAASEEPHTADERAAVESAAVEAPVDSASEVELLFQEPETHPEAPEQPETQQPEIQQPESEAAQAEQTQAEQTQGAPSTSTDAVFIPPLVEPVAAPTTAPQSALSDAMAEFEALTRSPQEPTDKPTAADGEPQTAPAGAEPAKPDAAASAPFSFLLNPAAASEPATPANTASSTDETDSASYTPPIGHWSRQAELDDENQPFENTLSRDVGGGNVATTTNALVLPMIPQRDDFSSVLNATGEIMVTGTINLPGSVGTTGRDSRHYDDPEVDHLFDAFDNEIPNTDSAPVRAITAVSSHTATRGGIEPGRKQNNRVLTVLLVTAGVLAVGVFGLLIAGFVFNIF